MGQMIKKYEQGQATKIITLILFLLIIKDINAQRILKNAKQCSYFVYYNEQIKQNLLVFKYSSDSIKSRNIYLDKYYLVDSNLFIFGNGALTFANSYSDKFNVSISLIKLINRNCTPSDSTLKYVRFTIGFDEEIVKKQGNTMDFNEEQYYKTSNFIKSCRAKFIKNKLVFKIGTGLFKKRKVILIDESNYYKMPEILENFVKEKIKLTDYWISFNSKVEHGSQRRNGLILKGNIED